MELRIFAARFVVFSLFAMAALVGPGLGGGVEGYDGRAERESGGVEGEERRGVEGEILKPSAPKIVWMRPKDLTEDFLRANQKPVLMLVHKSWCATCARLWSQLAGGGEGEEGREELERLANHFVLVNAADADEPMERRFAPDGSYIPRVLFLSPNGTVRPDVKCSLNPTPDFFYFYNSVSQIVKSMRTTLSIFSTVEEI